jgi:hypothetical protein
MKFSPEAFKHGKMQEDIEFVYASYLTEWFPNGFSERGNERAMLVGFDADGNLTEVALELISKDGKEDEEYFYHAMKATPMWQKEYETRRRHHGRQ